MGRYPSFLKLILPLLILTSFASITYGLKPPQQNLALPAIVFVARSHLATEDSIFSDELGPAGQFGTGIEKFAPYSRLVLRQTNGTLTVYNTPGLIDIQSPDVNFAGTKIVFAGTKSLNPASANYGWRLYEINVNGTGFQQLTFSDSTVQIPNASQFGNQETYGHYDDLFPAYLADGRIVFNSSRYPTRAHYDGRRTFNVYIMNSNGTNMRRITTERASALHPTPLPDGRILVSRWWNQFNQPSDQLIYNRIDNAPGNTVMPDGTIILANPDQPFNPAEAILPEGYEVRRGPNTWHLMTLNPDGTDFRRVAWTPRYVWNLTDDSGTSDTYAAAQPAPLLLGNDLHIAYVMQPDNTMVHSTFNTGIRVARPGLEMMYSNTTDAIAGLSYDQAWGQGNSNGPYALHPWGLPDGTILYSQSSQDNSLPASGNYSEGSYTVPLQGSNVRYRLYNMNIDGSNKTLVAIDLSAIGMATADIMDAKPVVVRTGWTALPDTFTDIANDDPRFGNVPNSLPEYWFSQNGPNDIETATIHNPNVYANASLYAPFANNSPPPGSIATAQVWIDANQFTGAYCYNGWPQPCNTFRADNELRAVLWTEVPVTFAGAFTATVPADTMGFIVLRDANGRVVRDWNRGYISIAQGSAWARPGETVTCVGCHMGHVSGSIDDVLTQSEQGWTNVAPYAAATASSHHEENNQYQPFIPARIIDRRGWVPLPAGGPVPPEEPYLDAETGWISQLDLANGQWVELTWPSDMRITQILLVGAPPNGGDWDGFGEPAQYGDYYVETGTLRLYHNGSLLQTINVGRVDPLADGGTLITLASPVVVDRLRFTINSTSGRWWWSQVAALNEIEVIGAAAEPFPLLEIYRAFAPAIHK
ncbi:MAG: hypothetical protein IPL78_00285 [Chloroflexi bacterium]|nr:hypothetical protein [Chloroflexota bacterium]